MQLRSAMPVSAADLFAWHERPGAFERLTPAFMPATVRSRTGGIEDGSRVTLSVPVGPLSTTWEVEHVGYVAGREFSDVQRSGPFARWQHRHLMDAQPDGTSVLDDRIEFALPAPPFGEIVAGHFTRDRLERLLRWRHALTRMDLERHAAFASRGPLRIAITGASGFLGDALVPFLTTGGHEVRRIGRRADSDFLWDPARGELDPRALDGVDAVIHLAGASIAERWTPERRRAIRESRVQGTRLIAEAMAKASPRPSVLLSASAVGVYGDRGDEVLDESSAFGDDFLAGVGREWEAAAARARDAGIRTVFLRTGVVLNPGGGALGKMLLPFQAGVGGKLGSGKQWMSWISREDWVGAVQFALMHDSLSGPVNLVAPEAATNATFTSTLARVLGRPALIPVPEFALGAVFGEMARGTILASQRAQPTVLTRAGFAFEHPTLSSALRFELGLL
ncbi:MAG: TIGR01777 family oxidoreductase [Gemmatimonadaceae bacterium]|nr:TIGR01777 family oxidoreductase [Gemmatimonadaceae bacterium]